jgi:hypothetical protein
MDNILYLHIDRKRVYGYILPTFQSFEFNADSNNSLAEKLQGAVIYHKIDRIYYTISRGHARIKNVQKSWRYIQGWVESIFYQAGVEYFEKIETMGIHFIKELNTMEYDKKKFLMDTPAKTDLVGCLSPLDADIISIAIFGLLHYQKLDLDKKVI